MTKNLKTRGLQLKSCTINHHDEQPQSYFTAATMKWNLFFKIFVDFSFRVVSSPKRNKVQDIETSVGERGA